MIQFYDSKLNRKELPNFKYDLKILEFIFLIQSTTPLLVKLNPDSLQENYRCELHFVLCSDDHDAFSPVLAIFQAQTAVAPELPACLLEIDLFRHSKYASNRGTSRICQHELLQISC